MNKLNLQEGIRIAALLFFVNLFLAAGSYAFGCFIIGSKSCGFGVGMAWIVHHPVFPTQIPVATVFGFVVGAFGGVVSAAVPDPIKARLSHHKGALAWIVVVLLIFAFALWGLPNVYALRNF